MCDNLVTRISKHDSNDKSMWVSIPFYIPTFCFCFSIHYGWVWQIART